MGQYFRPIILDSGGKIVVWMNAHMYDQGLKLMEHAFLENAFVCTFEFGLSPEGAHYKSRVVWAGDYAMVEPSHEANLYQQCSEYNLIHPKEKETTKYRFVVNHSKKQFVNKAHIPNAGGFSMHPLPFLTCEGEGNNSAYETKQPRLVGSWARDVISVEESAPLGYHEIVFDFVEVL